MRKPKWAIRKIRNGRVKINGVWFYPSDYYLKYDSRLDGMTFRFGLFYTGDKWERKQVYMHSRVPEEPYRQRSDVINGRFSWEWWRPKESGE